MMPTQKWLFNHKEKSNDDMAIEDRQVNWRDIIVAALVIVTPIILALGNGMLNWTEKYGNGVFITVFGISFVLAYLIKQKGQLQWLMDFWKVLNRC